MSCFDHRWWIVFVGYWCFVTMLTFVVLEAKKSEKNIMGHLPKQIQ